MPLPAGVGWAAGVLLAVAVAALLWQWRAGSTPGARHYQRGLAYMEANRPGEAFKAWQQGVREDPKDPRCWEMLGDFYVQASQYENAALAYERASQLSPRNGQLFLKLSSALRPLGKQKETFGAAKRAMELLPNDGDALGRYGLLLKGEKQRPEALKALRRACELRPDDPLYFMAMVDLELDTLQMDQAEQKLRAYLARHPKDAEASFRMAVVYNHRPRTPENIKEAIRYAETALAGLPHDARPYTVLGQLYLDSNRVQDALRLYHRGYHAAPNAESLLRGLADCYTRLGRTREMELVSAEYQKVLKRHDRIDHLTHVMGFNNKDTEAGLELARLTEEEGLHGKARQYYEQLVRQAPRDSRTRRALSGFYARMGRSDLAQRALQPDFLP